VHLNLRYKKCLELWEDNINIDLEKVGWGHGLDRSVRIGTGGGHLWMR